jgi:hypothetical protein
MPRIVRLPEGTMFSGKCDFCHHVVSPGLLPPALEWESGAMGAGGEYQKEVAPTCPKCGRRLPRRLQPPPPAARSPHKTSVQIPVWVWIGVGLVFLAWMIGHQ